MPTYPPQQEQEIPEQDEIISKTIITQKHLTLDTLNYSYLNKYRLEKLPEPAPQSTLKIKNLPCTMVGNQLRKITEIEYGDRKFYIEDVYVVSTSGSEQSSKRESRNEGSSEGMQVESGESDNKSQAKKFCLFKKSKGKLNNLKRNTKNVAKNFCKSFLNHLKQQKKHLPQKQRQKLQTCINQVRSLTGHKKYYNNNVIWKIISSSVCKEHFRIFLERYARDWIENSKMEYKEVHLEAIEIYLRLYEKMTFLEGEESEEEAEEESDEEDEKDETQGKNGRCK